MTRLQGLHVTISEDGLKALLQGGTGRELPVPELVQALHRLLLDQGIVHGLLSQAIEQIAHALADQGNLPAPVLVARGTPPEVGHGQPVLCFTQPVNLAAEEDADDDVLATGPACLVGTGDLLVRLETDDASPGRTVLGREIPPAAAWGRLFRLNGDIRPAGTVTGLEAGSPGYPELVPTDESEPDILKLLPLVIVSDDRMQAFATLRPPLPGQAPLTRERLLGLLAEAGISYGLRSKAISTALDRLQRHNQTETLLVAKGRLPRNGNNAYLQYMIDVGPLPGRLLGDGRIDYRERNMFVGVSQGQLIARRIPATPGSPGMDVQGQEVAQLPGRDLNIAVTDEAAYDPETGEVRALRSGVLHRVSDNSLRVCSCQMIDGDVDYQIGNIVSRDSVRVSGSIRPGFRIHALGDIAVAGNVEGAALRSDGHVVIKGGLTGAMATVRARGDADLKFIEHGRIFSRANIILRKSAYYCRLHAGGDLHCLPGSKAVSCQLVAGGSIQADTIGSYASSPCLVAAAVDLERFQLYFDLQRDLAAKQEELEFWRLRHGRNGDRTDEERLETEVRHCHRSINRLNLIPGTELESPQEGLSLALACSITVKGTIFRGTFIRIGNTVHRLEQDRHNTRFILKIRTDSAEPGQCTICESGKST